MTGLRAIGRSHAGHAPVNSRAVWGARAPLGDRDAALLSGARDAKCTGVNKIYAIAVVCALVGCGGDDVPDGAVLCEGDECICRGGTNCSVPCANDDACISTCEDFAGFCSLTCDDACDLTCNNGPTCNMSCGGDCLLSCRETQLCNADCGENCVYNCANAATCAVVVGANSSVRCEDGSTCNVTCTGVCRVRCQDVGTCSVLCPSSLDREICDDGFACGNC